MVSSQRYLDWRHSARTAAWPACFGETPAGDDVILGCATGYTADELGIFVQSMRKVHKGPAGLLVYNDEQVMAFLNSHDILALVIPRQDNPALHIAVRRFAYIANALRMHQHWGRAFVCDTRDVAFQRSPFEDPLPNSGLEVHQERETGLLGDHAATKKWTRRAFGNRAFEAIADQAALCVGSMVFARQQGLALLAVMDVLFAIPRANIGGAFGTDQAALNYAVHAQLVDADIAPNLERVATIGAVRPDLEARPDGRLVNQNGSMPAVIHQFDRCTHYTRFMETWSGAKFFHSAKLQGRSPLQAWLSRRLTSISTRTPELR